MPKLLVFRRFKFYLLFIINLHFQVIEIKFYFLVGSEFYKRKIFPNLYLNRINQYFILKIKSTFLKLSVKKYISLLKKFSYK